MTGPTRADVSAALNERNRQVRAYVAADGYARDITPAHLHAAAVAYLDRGGKGLRPALVLLCCGAVGGQEEWALPAAAAVEITHNWTLIHDDVIDRDGIRRGGPAAHVAAAADGARELRLGDADAAHYGLAVAILAGDVGPSWAAHLMARLPENGVTPPALALELTTDLAAVTVRAILEGEALDVQMARAHLSRISLEEIEEMLARKTGALFAWAAKAGARVGSGDDGAVAALTAFARDCGVAFQYVDDVLPYVADERKVGKPADSDLREGKRTAVVVAAYRNADAPEREFMERTLGRSDASAADVEALKRLIVERGGVAFARGRAGELHSRALRSLKTLPAGKYRDILKSLGKYLLERDY